MILRGVRCCGNKGPFAFQPWQHVALAGWFCDTFNKDLISIACVKLCLTQIWKALISASVLVQTPRSVEFQGAVEKGWIRKAVNKAISCTLHLCFVLNGQNDLFIKQIMQVAAFLYQELPESLLLID